MKGGHPTLIGYMDIPPGCSRLTFCPANGLKLVRLLTWGAGDGSMLRDVLVADERGIATPVPLHLYNSEVLATGSRELGEVITLAQADGPIFFQTRGLSDEAVELLQTEGNPVFLGTVLPGWAVTIDFEGPVFSLAFFAYEAT